MSIEEYKELPIIKGYWYSKKTIGYLKCDPDDYEWLKEYSIHVDNHRYPKITIGRSQSKKVHRLIMKAPDNLVVDHLNHDLWDCRKSNLRIVTNAVNCRNKKGLYKTNKTGYPGIVQIKNGKWLARVGYLGKQIYCGTFLKKEDAAQAAANKRAELGHLTNGKPIYTKDVEDKRCKIISTSNYPGIIFAKDKNKWRARIHVKPTIHLGYFTNIEDAIAAIENKKKELGIL